jgi:hypothetical protein
MEIAPRHINVEKYFCKKISIEYGNKICNEFMQCKDQRIESSIVGLTNHVYGKNHANNIHKKYLTMIIQNRAKEKLIQSIIFQQKI